MLAQHGSMVWQDRAIRERAEETDLAFVAARRSGIESLAFMAATIAGCFCY